MNKTIDYIHQHKERFLKELFELLSIPSISSIPSCKSDLERCAQWVADNLKQSGMSDVKIIQTKGHPIIYSEWMGAGAKVPTVLIYGHYDVQPVDPLELWHSEPFKPEIRNGKIFARGSADDKGQFFSHIKSVESFFKTKGKLPVNIKFLLEGEEEAGSSNLDEFIETHAELLKCDTVLVSDTEWFAEGLPTICYGLRGITFLEFTIHGPNRDLHSGSFGGAVDNPINVLCWMISQMKDKYGRITIPGFYDDVLELTQEEHEGFSKLPYNEKEYCEDLDINYVNGEIGYTTLERVWSRPSLDVNGIYGGYTGEGSKTILPSNATAKISMRLVPNQKTDDIAEKVIKYVKSLAPPTVKIEVKKINGGNPILVPRDSAGVKAAIWAFKEAFDKEPVFTREGGSIPVVGLFDSVLHAPTVLMGFGLPTDNIHSPNENYDLNNFYGSILTSAFFLDEMSKANI